ncbi:MAG: DMT family transporter [Synergistes sp.]|nr:DMT family transporter [Synergistes sp.]
MGVNTSLSIGGYAALLIAVMSFALYSVFVAKAQNYTGEEITFVMLLSGAAVFIIMAFLQSVMNNSVAELAALPFTNKSFLIACLYQGIGCSVLAFFLYNVAIAKIGVNRTSSFIGIATVVSVVAGVLILKEPFTPFQWIGVVLIIAGVYIANSKIKE